MFAWLLAPLFALGASGAAGPALAGPGDPIEVRWEAPPTCPSEASVRARIERHIGRGLTEIRDRRLSIIATAHPDGTRWSLTIFTVTTDGTQERTLKYDRGCGLLAEAAAVLIAMTIDPQVLGRLDAATLELVRARDEDVCPLRAISPIVEATREIARRERVATIDYPALLDARNAATGAPARGADWFLDHVHPTIEGHRVLARELLAHVGSLGWLPDGAPGDEAALARAEAGAPDQADPDDPIAELRRELEELKREMSRGRRKRS